MGGEKGSTRIELVGVPLYEGDGGGMLWKVFGWRPDLKTFSWPNIPPETHLPSCLPRHGFVRSLGAVSANAPHVTHQKVGSLTTMQCLRPAEPFASVISPALAVEVTVAFPWHDCGANLLHVMDLALHSVHHQPAARRCSEWPPSPGLLALVVIRLPVWRLTSVSCRFTAAAAAALARDAWVSLPGSPCC